MAQYKKRTIYQILVEAGLVKSNKDAVDLARSKKVVVNGKTITSLHHQTNPRKSQIIVDGREIKLEDKRKYFIFNKPKGLLTTKEDILPFLKGIVKEEELFAFYPVGRLDKNTTGLLIITNDGRLGDKILNPKQKIPKTYETVVERRLSEESIRKLEAGVEIKLEENGEISKYHTLPSKIKILSINDNTKLEITISEGKKRQVRRMFETVKHEVLELKRIKIGKLELENLKSGEIKELPRHDLFKALFE
ncbi:rRNA pseudouridine synthase [archaeon]|nr:rRNA pseudouridine synthase [archaeon]